MSNPWENPGTDPGSVEPGQEQKKDEQEKTPIPSMPKVYKTGAWYVFVPLVIKLVVSMVVSMAAAGIYSFFTCPTTMMKQWGQCRIRMP